MQKNYRPAFLFNSLKNKNLFKKIFYPKLQNALLFT